MSNEPRNWMITAPPRTTERIRRPFWIGMTKVFRAKAQEDVGGLLLGDDVESHWIRYKIHAALVKVTHRHP
jgi:hypothetical protein